MTIFEGILLIGGLLLGIYYVRRFEKLLKQLIEYQKTTMQFLLKLNERIPKISEAPGSAAMVQDPPAAEEKPAHKIPERSPDGKFLPKQKLTQKQLNNLARGRAILDQKRKERAIVE